MQSLCFFILLLRGQTGGRVSSRLLCGANAILFNDLSTLDDDGVIINELITLPLWQEMKSDLVPAPKPLCWLFEAWTTFWVSASVGYLPFENSTFPFLPMPPAWTRCQRRTDEKWNQIGDIDLIKRKKRGTGSVSSSYPGQWMRQSSATSTARVIRHDS